jgi:hypothetical protein
MNKLINTVRPQPFDLNRSTSTVRPQPFDLNRSTCLSVLFYTLYLIFQIHISYFKFIGISTKTLWADVSSRMILSKMAKKPPNTEGSLFF